MCVLLNDMLELTKISLSNRNIYIYPCPHVSKFNQVFNERFERHDSTCQSNKMCYNFAWCNEKQHEIGALILKYCD